MVLHVTNQGPRWVDPLGGVVSGERPEAVGRAVAGWAVVVGRDGRVVGVPDRWSGPESAGGEEVLADPVVRHDFGAMGVEIERHNVFLFPPSGQQLSYGQWLVRIPGVLTVVVDKTPVWVSDQGVLYESAAAMRAAGASPHPGALADGRITMRCRRSSRSQVGCLMSRGQVWTKCWNGSASSTSTGTAPRMASGPAPMQA